LHHLDAFIFVRETDRVYDRVIIDLPDSHNAMLDKLDKVDFYKMIKDNLALGGALATQMPRLSPPDKLTGASPRR
jgi:spermidine synthase